MAASSFSSKKEFRGSFPDLKNSFPVSGLSFQSGSLPFKVYHKFLITSIVACQPEAEPQLPQLNLIRPSQQCSSQDICCSKFFRVKANRYYFFSFKAFCCPVSKGLLVQQLKGTSDECACSGKACCWLLSRKQCQLQASNVVATNQWCDIVAYGARELGRQTSKTSSPMEQTPPAQTGSREEGLNGLNK